MLASLPAISDEPLDDPYYRYIATAPEFQPVKHDRTILTSRWDTWLYMPWRYQWTIGTGDEGGLFCREFGINGGFTDHGDGPFEWLEKWNLRFYNDHTAGKGYLYLRDANQRSRFQAFQRDARAIRQDREGLKPLDDALFTKLSTLVRERVARLRQSPMRVAYALDDEISWGIFVVPLPWRVHADDEAYQRWLDYYYGGKGPKAQFVTPDAILPQLKSQLKDIDLSPLLDRITYNDSVWANFLGRLVEVANETDPETPCGFVGGQAPNMWGGYDYAKLMKKIQFIEAYDLGSSQAIIRSFNPQNCIPQVTTHFHSDQRGTANDVWQSWYYFAHGNRGMIGWVEGWFEGTKPRPWLYEYRSTLKELGQIQGPKLVGARWVHDGIAIYYSHPSIQVSWCLDSEAHGRTWVNRGNDHRLGTSHLVRKAWEYILTDSGLQYSFISYDSVVLHGIPDEYRVLILPACYALSDAEAQRIREFCLRGGTVIADFCCGLFDQHGKARARGALDDLFGVTHDGTERAQDFFGERFWVETDQDAAYNYKSYRELFTTISCQIHDGYAVAEKRLPVLNVKKVGNGTAVYLNLSPQRYLQYREEGTADEKSRVPFVAPIFEAGVRPWIQVTSEGRRPANIETCYWKNGGRVFVFVVQNAPVTGSMFGATGATSLKTRTIPITVQLNRTVRDVRDERTGHNLGDGNRFEFQFPMAEAVFFSFRADTQ
ncbi:beta-galactosidase trimerization domain-containing protein [Thermogutta sp.]|uniref:beta-galactosidase trimerization domain-containing protein n=1 Tax=Thermogutta sp. TaxID=1962930 RepID=UPI003C7AF4AE